MPDQPVRLVPRQVVEVEVVDGGGVRRGGISPGPPDQAAIIELRVRYDIEQLTSMIPDRRRAAG
jgi:hypothetical protein